MPALFVVLVIAIYLEPTLGGAEDNPALRELDAWWLAAGIVAANALTLRRQYPLLSMSIVTAAVTFVGVAPYELAPVGWMIYVSAFALGRYSTLGRSLVGLALFAICLTLTLLSDQGLTGAGVAFVLAFGVLAWFAGRELQSWRDRVRVERANADLRVESERQARNMAITEERLRIAREVHDVVAHSMGLISVQAGMADAAFDVRPDEARRALGNILATSRSSLNEIRQVVGTLRDDQDGASSYRRPVGVAEFDALFADTEEHGLVVHRRVDLGGVLHGGVGTSIYRIVQQALTNVIEHADASEVHVTVLHDGGAVQLEIVDDGLVGRSHDSGSRRRGGFGIIGMRERARAFGGVLHAGPVDGGGFRVSASIPVPDHGDAPDAVDRTGVR